MEKSKLRGRLAPTVNGQLHLGNWVNLIITTVLVKSQEGHLKLRIDDADPNRCKNEFVDDLFKDLEFLKIDIDSGPSSVEEYTRDFSIQQKRPRLQSQAMKLLEHQYLYACDCSRKVTKKTSIYPRNCYYEDKEFIPYQTSLRYKFDCSRLPHFKPAYDQLGDFNIWTKEHFPSYLYLSFEEDNNDEINFVCRGSDLYSFSRAQEFLDLTLEKRHKLFFFHPIVVGEHNQKLSKSTQTTDIMPRDRKHQMAFKLVCNYFQTKRSFNNIKDLTSYLGEHYPFSHLEVTG